MRCEIRERATTSILMDPELLTLIRDVVSDLAAGRFAKRDFAAHASANRLRFDLWVRRNTELSGPLKQAVANGTINLQRIP